jgi:hypothetical protein
MIASLPQPPLNRTSDSLYFGGEPTPKAKAGKHWLWSKRGISIRLPRNSFASAEPHPPKEPVAKKKMTIQRSRDVQADQSGQRSRNMRWASESLYCGWQALGSPMVSQRSWTITLQPSRCTCATANSAEFIKPLG